MQPKMIKKESKKVTEQKALEMEQAKKQAENCFLQALRELETILRNRNVKKCGK